MSPIQDNRVLTCLLPYKMGNLKIYFCNLVPAKRSVELGFQALFIDSQFHALSTTLSCLIHSVNQTKRKKEKLSNHYFMPGSVPNISNTNKTNQTTFCPEGP